MSQFLFPRLSLSSAKLLAEKFSTMSPSEITEWNNSNALDGVHFAPTGGPKITDDLLQELRIEILQLANDSGYPNNHGQEAKRRFELSLARYFLELPIIPAEALRDEVWAFFSCRLVPEITAWRFGTCSDGRSWKTSSARFLPGVRNTFQRIWWRAAILRDPANEDDELWLLDINQEGLTEDNIVQLIERPGISTYKNLTLAIAREFVRYRPFTKETQGLSEEALLREAMTRILRVGAFANLDAIPEDARLETLRQIFSDCIKRHGGTAPKAGRVYKSFAARHLTSIDLPNSPSNQHEIQGVTGLRHLLGDKDRELNCLWKLYFRDGSLQNQHESRLKWYDARAKDPTRSEWRLYYPRQTPMEKANEGDLLLLASLMSEKKIHAFILPKGSPIYLQVRGALSKTVGQPEVPDDIEEYLRQELHRRT